MTNAYGTLALLVSIDELLEAVESFATCWLKHAKTKIVHCSNYFIFGQEPKILTSNLSFNHVKLGKGFIWFCVVGIDVFRWSFEETLVVVHYTELITKMSHKSYNAGFCEHTKAQNVFNVRNKNYYIYVIDNRVNI